MSRTRKRPSSSQVRSFAVYLLGGVLFAVNVSEFVSHPQMRGIVPVTAAIGAALLLLALKERIPSDPAGLGEAKDTIKTTLLEQKRQEAMESFINHLKERAQKEGALAVEADAVSKG